MYWQKSLLMICVWNFTVIAVMLVVHTPSVLMALESVGIVTFAVLVAVEQEKVSATAVENPTAIIATKSTTQPLSPNIKDVSLPVSSQRKQVFLFIGVRPYNFIISLSYQRYYTRIPSRISFIYSIRMKLI